MVATAPALAVGEVAKSQIFREAGRLGIRADTPVTERPQRISRQSEIRKQSSLEFLI